MRKQFFEQLINYFESQKNPDYEKTEEFRKSLNRLDDFVGK
ncbi:MAG: hypothetical protein ABEI74_00210 [Candidatus Pacearchaeota archaeon]